MDFGARVAGLRRHSPMLHPEHYCSRRRVRGQSDWLGFLCKTLSFSVSSRFIPALSLTPFTDEFKGLTPFRHATRKRAAARTGPRILRRFLGQCLLGGTDPEY